MLRVVVLQLFWSCCWVDKSSCEPYFALSSGRQLCWRILFATAMPCVVILLMTTEHKMVDENE